MILPVFESLHDVRFVAAAALIALAGSWFVFLELAELRYARTASRARLATIAAGSGATVWATHFTAMLGYRPDLMLTFSPAETALSALAAMALIGPAIICVGLAPTRATRLAAGAAAGGGVAAMHHVGMAGLAGCVVTFDAAASAGSTLAAMAFGAGAAGALHARRAGGPGAAALLFVAGVIALHFGANGGVTLALTGDRSAGLGAGAILALQIGAALLLAPSVASFVRRQLRAAREARRARRIALAQGEGIATVDHEGRVRWVNQAFLCFTGRALRDCAGRPAEYVFCAAASAPET